MPETDDLLCSFCGQRQQQVNKLIAGPDQVFVCDQCLNRVQDVLAEPGQTASTPIAAIVPVSETARTQQCSFCGKRRRRVAAMAAARSGSEDPGRSGSALNA